MVSLKINCVLLKFMLIGMYVKKVVGELFFKKGDGLLKKNVVKLLGYKMIGWRMCIMVMMFSEVVDNY